MGDVTRTIKYRGGIEQARMLVQVLEREGVAVDWSPPPVTEERSPAGDVIEIVVEMVATGSMTGIAAAVKKFRRRAPRTWIEVEGEDSDDPDAGAVKGDEGDDGASTAGPDLIPQAELLGGVAGARGGVVSQYLQERYRRRQQRYSDAVQEDSGMEAEAIAARIAEEERLGDLFAAGGEASTRTAEAFRIRLLARVVAETFTGSAVIDESEIRLQTLREMTNRQIQALAVLGRLDAMRPPRSLDAVTEGGSRVKAQFSLPRTGAAAELRRYFDVGANMAEAIAAALTRYGLIHNDPSGLAEWGLTGYGRDLVTYIHGVGIGAS